MTERDEPVWSTGAKYAPLANEDPALARRLSESFVETFLHEDALSERRAEEAQQMLSIDTITGRSGERGLRVRFPFSGITSETEWDGTPAAAEEIVDSCARLFAENVCDDRDMFGPTGWEPDFDEDK